MIRKLTQGHTVLVGLRLLKVKVVLDDAAEPSKTSYLMTNLAGALLYKYTPGGALESISFEQATALLVGSGITIEQAAPKAVQRAAYHAEVRRRINALEFDHV